MMCISILRKMDIGYLYTIDWILGLTIQTQQKEVYNKWTLGIYNAYNRQNAYYLYFKTENGSD